MSDIVLRLRAWVYAVDAVSASDLMDEAADEIERLRRQFSSQQNLTDKPVTWAANIPGKFGAAPTMLFGYTENIVKSIAAAGGDVVKPFPLYRQPQPTLTDEEREAVAWYW